MRKIKAVLKKAIVLIIGLPIVTLGLILIPLPGPGVIITLLGFAIISLGFDSMKKHRDKCLTKLKKSYQKFKQAQKSLNNRIDKF